MGNFNFQFILSILIIALGFVLKKNNLINVKDGQSMTKIIFNITLPSLIFNTLSTMVLDFSLIIVSLISLFFGLLMSVIALFIFRKESRKIRGMLSMLLPGFNVGLFAYPLVQAIWGEEGVKYFAMFDLSNTFILFGVCFLFASYFSSDDIIFNFRNILGKMMKSVPLLASVIALTANLIGLHFPSILLEVTKTLSMANKPLALLVLGVYLSFDINSNHIKNMTRIIVIRYCVGLIIGITFFYCIPFGEILRYTVLIGLILPIGMGVLAFAVQFKYDEFFVGSITNVTTVISFILIWMMVTLTRVN